MNALLQEQLNSFASMKHLHAEVYGRLAKARKQVNTLSMEELADLSYMLRELSKLADDIKKESFNLKGLAEKIACVLWVNMHMNEPEGADPIRTELCTATPHVQQRASLPNQKANPKEYALLMDWLGVPKTIVEQDLVRCHWPSFQERIHQLLEQGKPLPAGVNVERVYDEYSLIVRKKKDLDELTGD
jgi:hypothetical protein